MIPTFRVSHVAAFARWRDDEESEVGWLIDQIRSNEENEAMRKGTAFHKALETIKDGWEGTEITSGEYRFVFTCDIAISLPETRETRRGKDYGGIIISGQADGIGGKQIIDHKTTARFDAEKYLEGQQWRYYLDIFEADRFDWYAWEMAEIEPRPSDFDPLGQDSAAEPMKAYEVFGFHRLTQYRYPELEKDCRELALDFKRFADRYLPDYNFAPTEFVRAPEPSPHAVLDQMNHEDVTAGDKVAAEEEAMRQLPAPSWSMFATRGHNLIAVGWRDGVLRCAFASKAGARFYCYPGVPEAEFQKLKNSPYPDRLFTTNIKGKFTAQAA